MTLKSQVNYYIDEANGNDSNNGTLTSPFQTINHAGQLSQPGDTINVLPGIYTIDTPDNPWDNIAIANSGNPEGYITYRGISDESGQRPTLVSASNACFTTFDKSYIVIENFEVTTVEEDVNNVIAALGLEQWRERVGFNILNNSHHIIVRDCYVHDFPGNAFQCGQSDVILLENNLVEHNAFHSDNGNSGISMFQMIDIEVPGFVNEPDYRLIIRGNTSRYNVNLRGFSGFENKLTDGNGIIVDDLRHEQDNGEPYTGRTLVFGNIVYGNGGQGINVFSSDNVDIYHNSMYDNGLTTRIENPAYEVVVGNSQLQVGDADNIDVRNNILVNTGTGRTLNRFNESNVTYNQNIHWNSTGNINDNIDANDLIIDPLFSNVEGISNEQVILLATMTNPFEINSPSAEVRNPTVNNEFKIQDLSLSSNSPAIGTAEDLGFFSGTTIDIGAIQSQLTVGIRGLKGSKNNQVILYPNIISESEREIQIQKNKTIGTELQFSITDINGANERSLEILENGEELIRLRLPSVKKGSYLIVGKSDDEILNSTRLIVN